MLYKIYNKLIESFKLDKNIKICGKYLDIKKEDFKPNIFDDLTLGKYFKLMISSAKPYLCDKLKYDIKSIFKKESRFKI